MLLNVDTGVRISSKKWQITCTGLFYFWGYCFIASNVLISSTEHRREKTFAQFLIFGCDITPCSFWAGLVWNIKARKTDPSHLERNAVTYGQRLLKCLLFKALLESLRRVLMEGDELFKAPEGETWHLEKRRVVVRLRWKVKTYWFLSLLTEWCKPDSIQKCFGFSLSTTSSLNIKVRCSNAWSDVIVF